MRCTLSFAYALLAAATASAAVVGPYDRAPAARAPHDVAERSASRVSPQARQQEVSGNSNTSIGGGNNICVGSNCDCSDTTLDTCASGLPGVQSGGGRTVNCNGDTCTTIIVSNNGAQTTTLTGAASPTQVSISIPALGTLGLPTPSIPGISRPSTGAGSLPTITVTSGSGNSVSTDTKPNGQTVVTVGNGNGALQGSSSGMAAGVAAAAVAGLMVLAF